MSYRKDNVFYGILQGSVPANVVFEDENVLAFNDIAPKAPTHVLVIPKKLVETFGDFCAESATDVGRFFQKVHEVARSLGVGEGYKITIHNGAEGGQEVFHLHAHILANTPAKSTKQS